MRASVAARSAVSTKETQSAGRPAETTASRSAETIAALEWRACEPPRSTHALPDSQANARSIGRDVRARLIHHGDNAQRHAHARKLDAAFDFAALEHAAQRVRQAGERFKGIGHGIDAAFI